VHGIGPETADDILLYAFHRPVFVIDAYTRRIFHRLGFIHGTEDYETLRRLFEDTLGPDVALYNEYHALIVRHGKDICRARPKCALCCLARICPASTRIAPIHSHARF
jgi:endonuclease-3 related protein